MIDSPIVQTLVKMSSGVEIEQQLNLSTTDLQTLGDIGGVKNIQLYNPIYPMFFNLNESNWNNISLNQKYHIQSKDTVIEIIQKDGTEKEKIPKNIFIKYSPLLDPVKYMTGKYDINDTKIRTLPNLTTTSDVCHSKMVNPMNSSYVDNFFYYLSSMMKNKYGFVHGIDFYGSFLGIQEKFKMKVEDDLSYLAGSSFFLSNIGKLMVLENVDEKQLISDEMKDSRCKRSKVCIGEGDDDLLLDIETLDIAPSIITRVSDSSWDEPCEIVYNTKQNDGNDADIEDNNDSDSDNSDSDDSSNSSDSSNSDSSNSDSDSDSDSDNSSNDSSNNSINSSNNSDNSDWEDIESDEEPEPIAHIFDFPIQMICLEQCENTLDSLLEDGELEHDKYASILFQIVITLLVYQKVFKFTHNDLHTNNIMFIKTEQEFLYYIVNGKSYKVPTYGYIFKLIDFGRSIYKYNSKIFCSDSFEKGGDGHTQYNCEPFMNNNKPRLEPNMSFDLCRLGCSIFDFIDDEDEESIKDDFFKTIERWCNDDSGDSVLYKKNGKERYAGFKLYRMISRTVHNHTPEEQLKLPFFKQFESILDDSNTNVMNIDSFPILV